MKSLEIVMLPVKDRQKAKEFYLKLGFKVIIEAPAAHGETWLQMGLPDGNTTISLSGLQAVIYETADIEAEIKKLNKQGIEVGKVDETPWGKFAWFKDLDGNEFGFKG